MEACTNNIIYLTITKQLVFGNTNLKQNHDMGTTQGMWIFANIHKHL